MSEQGLVVKRWKRYGKDRLYVTFPDETKVGFWDLAAGEGHPETPEQMPALLRAVEDWKRSQPRHSTGERNTLAVAIPSRADFSDNVSTGELILSPVASASAPDERAEPAGVDPMVESPWLDVLIGEVGQPGDGC